MEGYELGFDEIEIQTESATLGEGFNSISLQSRPEVTLFTEETLGESEIKRIDAPKTEIKYFVSESAYDLSTKLGVHTDFSLKYLGFRAGGSADYVREESFSEKSFVFVFWGQSKSYSERLKPNPKILPDKLAILQDPKRVLFELGDYYCSELIYGGELILFVSVMASSREEKETVKAALNASIGYGAFDGSMNASLTNDFNQKTASTQTSCQIYQVGATSSPKSTNFSTNIQYALAYFNDKTQSNSLMRAKYRPITKLSLSQYKGGMPDVMRNLHAVLLPLWKKRDEYLSQLADYHQLQNEFNMAFQPDSTYYLPKENFDDYQEDLSSSEKRILEELKRNDGGYGLQDPSQVIPNDRREKFKKQLESRKIESTDCWGRTKGMAFLDHPANVERITEISLGYYNPKDFGFQQPLTVCYLGTTILLKDGQKISFSHGLKNEKVKIHDLHLNEGDFIQAVEVRYDDFVRQVTLKVKTKEKQDLETFGPFPNVPDPEQTWPDSSVGKKEKIHLVSFYGHVVFDQYNQLLTSLGAFYIDLEGC